MMKSKKTNYLTGDVPLEDALLQAFDELEISAQQRKIIRAFMAPLKHKDSVTREHYEHSIRVGLLTYRIAQHIYLDGKAGLYAGLLHDIGKAQVDLETLGKTQGWTEEDSKKIRNHVLDGYRILKGRFNFTAEIIAWHHRFQANGYPESLPPLLHEYSEGTKLTIALYGRLLALADYYDASHRKNSRSGGTELAGSEIKEKLLEHNPDQKLLIEELYRAGIFTT